MKKIDANLIPRAEFLLGGIFYGVIGLQEI